MSWMDDYEPVEVRLQQFWSEHPDGRVSTACPLMGQNPGDLVVFRCAIYRDINDRVPWATGFAHQRILPAPPSGKYGKPNESAPEWTSPYEVCETSAIGRALANAGYAAKGRPTKEEVNKTTSANELFDVSPWLEQLNDGQLEKLKEWWKKTDGLNGFQAKAIPGSWLGLVEDQIKFLKENV